MCLSWCGARHYRPLNLALERTFFALNTQFLSPKISPPHGPLRWQWMYPFLCHLVQLKQHLTSGGGSASTIRASGPVAIGSFMLPVSIRFRQDAHVMPPQWPRTRNSNPLPVELVVRYHGTSIHVDHAMSTGNQSVNGRRWNGGADGTVAQMERWCRWKYTQWVFDF